MAWLPHTGQIGTLRNNVAMDLSGTKRLSLTAKDHADGPSFELVVLHIASLGV